MLKYILMTLVLVNQFSIFAQIPQSETLERSEVSQGEVLERKMWEYIKKNNWGEMEKKVAPSFQLALYNNVYNKEQYLNRAKTLKISDFILSNFKVTESSDDVIIVTYNVAVSETIEGKRLTSKAIRLSVWEKNDDDNWQWIAHAVLIPVASDSDKSPY